MRSLCTKVLPCILLTFGVELGWADDGRIPKTLAPSLTGDRVVLPDGLRGKVGVLVLGLSQSSREGMEWDRRLAAEYRQSPVVLYYEMPVLTSVPRLFRGLVVKSIKVIWPGAGAEPIRTHNLR